MNGFGAPTIPRVKFGDHVGYNGIYVGLIIDVGPGPDDVLVATRNSMTGKVDESVFKASTLRIMEARR